MRKFCFYGLIGLIILGCYCLPPHASYETLNKKFSRLTSHVMVRNIDLPTAANLDAAAYIGNPLLYDPRTISPKRPAKKINITDCTFGGVIVSPCVSIAATPLTRSEKKHPLAWEPLKNSLWTLTESDVFAKITATVNGRKWADSSIFTPYQEIVCAFLHRDGDSASLWVKIEFKPWVTFLDGIFEEGNDGSRECYGRLNLSGLDHSLFKKAITWIQSDYTKTILTKAQVIDWANNLCFYWYTKFNTDIVDMTGQSSWPTDETEIEIRRELKGISIATPIVVIRGKPLNGVIYNVFSAHFLKANNVTTSVAPTMQKSAGATGVESRHIDSATSLSFKKNNSRFDLKTKMFGDYAAWSKKDEEFRHAISDYVKAKSLGGGGTITGKDDWLFDPIDIEYMDSGESSNQPPDDNSLQSLKESLTEFKDSLEKLGISFLFCPVPCKSDVYFENLPAGTPPPENSTIINPCIRKFLRDLQLAGVEVIDLLPDFLSAKREDPMYKNILFMKHDGHWNSPGIAIAATCIADRIRHYPWFGEATTNPVHYTLKDTTFNLQGALGGPAEPISIRQVFSPDGSLFKPDNPDSPVLLIGDSFTGIFETLYGKGSGLGAHIAAETGLPIDAIAFCGASVEERIKVLNAHKNNVLSKKRLVIFEMTVLQFYHFNKMWPPLQVLLQDK